MCKIRPLATLRSSQLGIVLFCLACWSCATVVGGRDQDVQIRSQPPGANLEIVDLRSGERLHSATTPFTALLPRGTGYFQKARYRVVMDKESYDTQELVIEGALSPWYLYGNIGWGGLGVLGWFAIDPVTGAMWKLRPNKVEVELAQRRVDDISAAEVSSGEVLGRKSLAFRVKTEPSYHRPPNNDLVKLTKEALEETGLFAAVGPGLVRPDVIADITFVIKLKEHDDPLDPRLWVTAMTFPLMIDFTRKTWEIEVRINFMDSFAQPQAEYRRTREVPSEPWFYGPRWRIVFEYLQSVVRQAHEEGRL